jgi:hypothetical protein
VLNWNETLLSSLLELAPSSPSVSAPPFPVLSITADRDRGYLY